MLKHKARPRRARLFGIEIDPVDMAEAVDTVYGWISDGDERCRFVVTPNVDHAVVFQENPGLRRAYMHAALVLADGMPVVAAAQMLGCALRGRVAGSDLPAALFEKAQARGGLRVFLLGAAPGVAERAAVNIALTWPTVRVVGTLSPPIGFERDASQNQEILDRIADARPDVLIVGLGAPKQEQWVDTHRHQIRAAAALCLGGTIDFLAGDKQRAPSWMQRIGLEWLYRVACEPRRLMARYLRGAHEFPRLVLRQAVDQFRGRSIRRVA